MRPPRLPRTAQAFRRWLAQSPAPTSIVGYRGRAQWCPLAQYLRAQGADKASVNGGSRYVISLPHKPGATQHRMPAWAGPFAWRLDARGAIDSPVTAAEALAVLETTP